MKITCDFCKTEYCVDRVPCATVKCAVCGNTWTVRPAPRRGAFLLIFASVCALMSAVVFTVAVVLHHRARDVVTRPLTATVTDVRTVSDASGGTHFVVSGTVTNHSDEIYGLPNLIVTSLGENDVPLARQRFLPSATLLDAGASVTFTHTLAASSAGVKKITVDLAEIEETPAP